MEMVVLLNGDYQPHDTITWRKALSLLAREKVEAFGDEVIRVKSVAGDILIPKILRLLKIVRQIYKHGVRYNKNNIFTRDGYKCCYCGDSKSLTLDHIIPRSRGGKSTFENVVTCCKQCNQKKGDKTPQEVNMYLKKLPYQPTIGEYIQIKMKSSSIYDIIKHLFE